MKKRRLILLGIVLLCCAWLLFCFVYKKVKYSAWLRADEEFFQEFEENRMQNNGKGGKRYTFAGVADELWSIEGNLGVAMTNYFDETGSIVNDTVELLIWPKFFSGFTIAVLINPADSDKGAGFEINEDMSLIDESYREWYDRYYEDIYEDFKLAHEVFGIFEVPEQ